jgi:DNA-binding FrmR family transcriptional regulator
MSPNYLRYAEALATDLEVASQTVSAKVVRRLLEERADLLAACEAMLDDTTKCDEVMRMIRAAIAKAKEARP